MSVQYYDLNDGEAGITKVIGGTTPEGVVLPDQYKMFSAEGDQLFDSLDDIDGIKVEITEEDYRTLVDSKNYLFQQVGVEERFAEWAARQEVPLE